MPSRGAKSSNLRLGVLVVTLVGALVVMWGVFWAIMSRDFRDGSNLKTCAIALKIYSFEHDGYPPPLSPVPGRLMFEMEGVYPNYIKDAALLISPADPIEREARDAGWPPAFCFENSSYFYMSYKVWDDETVEAFAGAYRKRIEEGLPFDTDLPVDLPIEKVTRLGDWIGGPMRTAEEWAKPKYEHTRHGNSEVPCMIERPHPYPGLLGLYVFGPVPLSRPVVGGVVLYNDGHTEFIRYPGKWPMTEKTISILTELSELRQPGTPMDMH